MLIRDLAHRGLVERLRCWHQSLRLLWPDWLIRQAELGLERVFVPVNFTLSNIIPDGTLAKSWLNHLEKRHLGI